MRKNIIRRSCGKKKGSVTIEFITVLPLVFFMCLFVWQFFVSGMAVMETRTLVRDGVRLAAATNNIEETEEKSKDAFPNTGNYYLSEFDVKILEKDGQVQATAKTKVEYVFLPLPPFTYEYSAKAPLVK